MYESTNTLFLFGYNNEKWKLLKLNISKKVLKYLIYYYHRELISLHHTRSLGNHVKYFETCSELPKIITKYLNNLFTTENTMHVTVGKI